MDCTLHYISIDSCAHMIYVVMSDPDVKIELLDIIDLYVL